MIFVDLPCDKCKNRRENIDGWNCCCDAFPKGIPYEILKKKPDEMKDCNNGIGYEPKDET